jgi:regulation of enolase protein 1 (concanavalin A-like superfamily)
MARFKPAFWMLTVALLVTVGAARPAQADLPAGWAAEDIGAPDPAGKSDRDASGIWSVSGAGGDIENESDQFHFAYQKLAGDGTITVRFLSMESGDPTWTKMGPMIRESVAEDAQNITLQMTTAVGVRVQAREDALSPDTQSNIPPALSLTKPEQVWMRLTRVGNQVASFFSHDGATWLSAGPAFTLSKLPAEALFGIAVTSHLQGTLATGRFDNVVVQPGVNMVMGLKSCKADNGVMLSWQKLAGAESYDIYRGPEGETDLSKFQKLNTATIVSTTFVDSSADLVVNRPYTYMVVPALKRSEALVAGDRAGIVAMRAVPTPPPGYTITSVNEDPDKAIDYAGDCLDPTGAFFDATTGKIVLRGAGPAGIADVADQFNFTHQEVEGNFQVVVRALTRPIRTANPNTAGLMIREGLTPGARMAALLLTGSQQGLLFRWRDGADSAANQADEPLIGPEALIPPLWIRLTRNADTITAEYSMDGATWQGETKATISGLAAKLNAGLAISSHQSARGRQITEATFEKLSVVK